MRSPRRLRRVVALAVALVLFLTLLLHWRTNNPRFAPTKYPLLARYVTDRRRDGGVWYLPPEWTRGSGISPSNIVEAAECALNLSRSTAQRQLPHSTIPLILHQTWKNTNPETWPDMFRQSTEKWLGAVEDSTMAYFLWDDDGIAQFIKSFEPGLEDQFYALPSSVERSDVFRILVSKWIGGIYGDMDTEPIRSPTDWITSTDILSWRDPETGHMYNSTEPVQAIVGLEADCSPDTDLYWRMGYTYPVQLTQWSFAWTPRHPILQLFLDHLFMTLHIVSSNNNGHLESNSAQQEMYALDPLTFTGPVAFTDSVRMWLESTSGLRWNALSGLRDGGLSKLVGEVLVLPITGFSPGRGQYGNMGSKSVTDPSARLVHHAQGSWRKTSLLVEYGKFCRTVFGRCRDWSKVPHNFIT
ncbi:hypothetical protein P175DRAFT_087860 [Aspergillus ochraceoroseus IBT 24754]|uniref:Glycosyl transferase n=1 Tax=Aspergillus ochraceoroseus IBT 24754 TaxID=1392256 RepID=A0A2T5MAX5_9EURO|nr:uncharacterized protein P175DRAFT_087860 [Aspergillus ochraceoroseus IBT 24754]PTU25670.1 hypothetical protein P175DRAFT_087860 [Aspergillus ochraceoroseus IBT 24754]